MRDASVCFFARSFDSVYLILVHAHHGPKILSFVLSRGCWMAVRAAGVWTIIFIRQTEKHKYKKHIRARGPLAMKTRNERSGAHEGRSDDALGGWAVNREKSVYAKTLLHTTTCTSTSAICMFYFYFSFFSHLLQFRLIAFVCVGHGIG